MNGSSTQTRIGTVLKAAIIIPCLLGLRAGADDIYGTNDECGDLGCNGFDVSNERSQAVRFEPTSDFTLDQIKLLFMNNDSSDEFHGEVIVTLEGDFTSGECSTPDGVPIETMSFITSAIGWNPVLETVDSEDHPLLEADTPYWIVCKSSSDPLVNPAWVIAKNSTGFATASVHQQPDVWQCGGNGAVGGIFITGTRVGSDYTLNVGSLVGGEPGDFTVSGAAPNSSTFLAASIAGEGSTFIKPLNVTLNLRRPFQAGRIIQTDSNGDGSWTLPVPPGASGRTVWVQSVQVDQRSNLVEATIQ